MAVVVLFSLAFRLRGQQDCSDGGWRWCWDFVAVCCILSTPLRAFWSPCTAASCHDAKALRDTCTIGVHVTKFVQRSTSVRKRNKIPTPAHPQSYHPRCPSRPGTGAQTRHLRNRTTFSFGRLLCFPPPRRRRHKHLLQLLALLSVHCLPILLLAPLYCNTSAGSTPALH